MVYSDYSLMAVGSHILDGLFWLQSNGCWKSHCRWSIPTTV